MSHMRIAAGALAVIALLFLAPSFGLMALAVFLVAGIAMWITEGSADYRPCPRCGEQVPNGVLNCEHCQFDFRTIGDDSVAT
jgi:hypothetical protein